MNICLTTPPTQSSHGVAHICAIGGVVVPDASVEIWLRVEVLSCWGITALKLILWLFLFFLINNNTKQNVYFASVLPFSILVSKGKIRM